MSALAVLVGLFAVASGVLGVVRPRLLFRLRHPLGVTPESQLSEFGVVAYRIGGVFSALVGLWVLATWT